MIQKTLHIQNKLGLHARASAKLVDLAGRFESEIYLKKEDATVNAKSIMGIMMLAAAKGSTLECTTEGEDEKEAIEAIEGLFNRKFDEEE